MINAFICMGTLKAQGKEDQLVTKSKTYINFVARLTKQKVLVTDLPLPTVLALLT